MANTRLEIAKERLKGYYEAEKAILSGQSYSIGGRTLNRANLSHVVKMIDELESQVARLEKNTRKVRRIIPID